MQQQRHLERNQQPELAPLVYSKRPLQPHPLPKQIEMLEFGIQAPQEIVKASQFHVFVPKLYKMPERTPHKDGPLDTRLGVSLKKILCHTCGLPLADCAGHFGYIQLQLPVFHIGYFKDIIAVLQCVCKSCSRVLLSDAQKDAFLRKFRNPRLERVQSERLFKKLVAACRKPQHCLRCGEFNGGVKKASNTLKIVHDRYMAKTQGGAANMLKLKAQLKEAANDNPAIKPHLDKLVDDINPVRALHLFAAIPDVDTQLLDLSCRPEHLIITHMTVPPVGIRPSVEMEGGAGSNEDDATIRLTEIINVNNAIRTSMAAGAQMHNIMEQWDFLQAQCALYINSDAPGLGSLVQPTGGRPLRGFSQRLKGKQGRFRGNLSGKRVDFSGRTVISPDPNLGVHEVCVPVHMATVLTFPECVTPHNIDRLRQCIINGPSSHPGANFLEYTDTDGQTKKRYLKFGDRRRIAAELREGNVVERHLRDGDVVLFNRQPSLHRISIMAHRARIQPYRTMRFNECVCNPYNADFDGDEMNLHVPQTEEARAEAAVLMSTTANLCTPKNGEVMICANQDFLTCAFLLSSRDVFFNRAQFCQAVNCMNDALEDVDLPTPALIKPVEMWTGKQLFSVLVRPNAATGVRVNVLAREKCYTRGLHMCKLDGYVCFRNSELLCGRLGKKTLGGNKSGLFGTLLHDCSAATAARVMNRLAKLSARVMGERGFSIGIDDVTPAPRLQSTKERTIREDYSLVQGYISQYQQGKLELEPGCDVDQSLESKVMGLLNEIREKAGRVCMSTLHWHNSPLIMSQCGSKGSPINIAQMMACVGQQSVGGKRCPNGFQDRTLPHFPPGDRTPQGKGFVANSFFSGLTPTEFFFHTMGGREGLVDTAVKTAETGYMSRRLMKCLEDLHTQYDDTVRNSAQGVVQFSYGDDNLDPVVMEGEDDKPLDFHRCLANARYQHPRPPGSLVLLPHEVRTVLHQRLSSGWLREKGDDEDCKAVVSIQFREDLQRFVEGVAAACENARAAVALPAAERGAPEVEAAVADAGVTAAELTRLLDACVAKYASKCMDPGATVGAFGAQSIGEPGTQMTLKTFHFAGVASMNVTLGVPRIKEIINAAKKIATPVITVNLDVSCDIKAARMTQARVQRTLLGDICRHIRLVVAPGEAHITVRLDEAAARRLQLDVDASGAARSMLSDTANKMKLKDCMMQVVGRDKVIIRPAAAGHQGNAPPPDLMLRMQQLAEALPNVIVAGVPTVERAIIHHEPKNGKYQLLVEGTNFLSVLGVVGVNGCTTTTNNVAEVEAVLGIEAARRCIVEEINTTMGSHGMQIDARHMKLLADAMTYKGEVLGITRFGIAKMKDSVMNLASFEKTTDHLFAAAIHGRKDRITGVSESIIMGIPMPTGTGMFGILHQHAEENLPPPRPDPVLV